MLERAAFLGTWQLHRDIDDRYSAQSGRFQGVARFREEGAQSLRYVEEGQIRFAEGPVLTAQRQYLWHFGANIVEVCFEDGSAFHRFVPMGQVDGTEHPCGDDHYTVRYDFRNWPSWSAIWQVTGPRKDYTSRSLYRR